MIPRIKFDVIAVPWDQHQPTQLRSIEFSIADLSQPNVSSPIQMVALAVVGPQQQTGNSFQISDSPRADVPLMIEAIAGWSRPMDVAASVELVGDDDDEIEEAHVAALHPYLLGTAVVLSSGVSFRLSNRKQTAAEMRLED